jgi:dephospho-CoA kinase
MIIGISGKYQSGKDTIAEYLITHYKFKRIAFADKLKDIAQDLFFWNGEKDAYGRKLLQDIGMKMREVKDDVWVNYVLMTVNDKKFKHQNFVITDVRFLNEAQLVKLAGGELWRINRDIIRDKSLSQHKSETDLDAYTDFNCVIENDKTINDLYEKVDKLLKGKEL